MKKTIRYLILTVIIICGITNQVEASSSNLRLDLLQFEAQINSDGSMDITEKWNIKISNTNTLYKTFKMDKTRFSNITEVEVNEITNGTKQPFLKTNQWSYHLSKGCYFGGMNENHEFEIAWGVGLEGSSVTKIYEISYRVEDAISKYSDYAELYWQFVGKDFEVDAKKIIGTIHLPNHVEKKDDIKVWGHTEDLNGEIYATDTNKIEFNIENFRSGRYVEIRTLFPTEMINTTNRNKDFKRLEEVIQEETTWANQSNAKRKRKEAMKIMVTVIANILSIVLMVFSIKSICKNIKKIKTRKKLKPTQKMQYFREVPREDSTPTESIVMLSKQINVANNSTFMGRIFSATLLDLSLKKVIGFEVKDKIITIKILKENPKELEELRDEKVIFEFLKKATKKSEGKITVKDLEKYIRRSQSKILDLGNHIEKSVEESLCKKDLLDKEAKEEKNTIIGCIIMLVMILPFILATLIFVSSFSSMAWIGILPCLLVLIIQVIVFAILSSKTDVFTQKGIDENQKWKGLEKYMRNFSMLDKKELPEIIIWEKFLVYATAFGIADKVLKQLKMIYPNFNKEWNSNQYVYMYLMLNTNFSSNFTNAINNSMSTTYSSATGVGGGFSVGGRRSDGGRRRWWRKIR